jgi:uncharacterized protein (DUF433 family)
MTTVLTSHIAIDDQGRPWIEGTKTKVIEVVLDWLAYGWSPEEIHRQHPHLPLAKIHAAFSYYYDHQAEIDAEIERQEDAFDQIKATTTDSPLRRRLRATGKLK